MRADIPKAPWKGWLTPAAAVLLVAAAAAAGWWGCAQYRESKLAALAATGLWRPQIHFYAGPRWNNDPNGPILLNGQYHLFYQYNPFGDQWGHMSWGHAVSADLVHWQTLPVALAEENGVMIFNGTAVADLHNTSGLCGSAGQETPGCLVAVYTGASKNGQNQNVTFSRDGGNTWTKYGGNPVIDLGLKDFRDPKVFWHEPSKSWVMAVVIPDRHKVQIYRSANLTHWQLASEFGPAGAVGGIWECPDLMELAVRDAQGQRVGSHWVLNVNLNPGGPAGGSASQYFVGQFDGFRFTEDHPGSGPLWADWGKDFYASTSFANIPKDQDRVWIAWMSNWQYAGLTPSMPGRGEMTLARRLFLRQIQVQPGAVSLALVQEPILPIPEHKLAADSLTVDQANARLTDEKAAGSVYALNVILEPGAAGETGVRLRRSTSQANGQAEEETVVGVDRAKGEIFVDRRRSGATFFAKDFPARTAAPLKHANASAIRLQIVVDRNSVEVFAEDGETVLTNLIYPQAASRGLEFYATPGAAGGEPARFRGVDFVSLELLAAAK
jgi:fructan beta-fructosidase